MNNKNPDVEDRTPEGQSRRGFLRKAVYASPVLLTLPAMPSFAQQGSACVPGDGGDPGGDPGGPGGGEVDCENQMQPIDSDVATSICHLGPQPISIINSDDLIVPNDALPDHLSHGDAFGTCDNFFCGAS